MRKDAAGGVCRRVADGRARAGSTNMGTRERRRSESRGKPENRRIREEFSRLTGSGQSLRVARFKFFHWQPEDLEEAAFSDAWIT